MNHNGVISLPAKPATAFVAGNVVALNSDGNADVPASKGADAVGIVLHDVDSNNTEQPVAVQLLSAGGSALVQVSNAVNAIGAKIYVTNNLKATTTSGTTNRLLGLALEKPNVADNIVRVIIMNDGGS